MTTFSQLINKEARRKKKRKIKRLSLEGCPQKKGVCYKVTTTTPRKPCSANRPFARVFLSNRRFAMCHIPGDYLAPGLHELKTRSHVLVRGGKPNDLPGVKYKIIIGKFDAKKRPPTRRKKARSRFGMKNEERLKGVRSLVQRKKRSSL